MQLMAHSGMMEMSAWAEAAATKAARATAEYFILVVVVVGRVSELG